MTTDDEFSIEERACIMEEGTPGLTRVEAMRLARELHHKQRVTDQVERIRRKLTSAGVETR